MGPISWKQGRYLYIDEIRPILPLTNVRDTTMNNFRISAGDHQFTFEKDDVEKLDILSIDETTYHLVHEASSMEATISHYDASAKKLLVEVNGTNHWVKIEGGYELLVEKMG